MKLLDIALPALDASGAAHSMAINSTCQLWISCQAILTGTAVGTLTMEVSNDPLQTVGQPATPTNWTPSTATVAINGAGSYLIPKVEIAYSFVRFSYSSTSGSGSLVLQVKAMGL